jgi:pyrophosphatase PpaX
MKDYKLYLFDVDGTLLDTTELIYQCYKYSLEEAGQPVPSREYIVSRIGLPLKTQLREFFGKLGEEQLEVIRQKHLAYQLSIYRDYLRVFPHVAPVLKQLKERGKKLAVVTSRTHDSLDLYLKEKDLFYYFDTLLTPAETVKHKPEPEPALKAMHLLQASAQETLFIGDSRWDMECGHNAGTDTAFVGWSELDAATMPVKPTYIIHDMIELIPTN